MNITYQYFLTLFDEFKKLPKEKINAFIAIASTRTPVPVWGDVASYATALLTAHMLSTSGPQGGGSAGGAVTQESVGDLSRTYATIFDASRGDAPYMTTRYGIDYIALRKETIMCVMSTRGALPPNFGDC